MNLKQQNNLGQAWWRYIQLLGLSKGYRDQTYLGLFLKKIFELLLFNIKDVEKCFVQDFISIYQNMKNFKILWII